MIKEVYSVKVLVILVVYAFLFVHLHCESEDENEKGKVHCEKPSRCTCPSDPTTGKYPDPNDSGCEKYYLCHMGNAFLRYCDVRQAFHPDQRECVSRANVPLSICPSTIDCEKNGYFPDPLDCTMYYICFYGQAYHYSCNPDNYFDKGKGNCVKDKKKSKGCSMRNETQPQEKRQRRRETSDSWESLEKELFQENEMRMTKE